MTCTGRSAAHSLVGSTAATTAGLRRAMTPPCGTLQGGHAGKPLPPCGPHDPSLGVDDAVSRLPQGLVAYRDLTDDVSVLLELGHCCPEG